jgi:CheY-like chemotaxis protein
VPDRPRLLLIGPPDGLPSGAWPEADVEPVPADPAAVAERLRDGGFAGVVAPPGVLAEWAARSTRDQLILQNIDNGLAILDPDGVVLWANPAFSQCAGENPIGRPLLEALGTGVMASDSGDPLAVARAGQPASLRLHRTGNPEQPFLEAEIRPVPDPAGTVTQLLAVVRNVTAQVAQQQKLDALHQAGRELAGLDPEQLAEMNVPSRVELLKINLRKFIHDLLNYDTIEVRLLDRKTGELKPLLEDGMLPEAANRVLYARPTDNGVTGFVAYTGKSYLCVDTANDPHYIAGAAGARSSMTVPLQFHDEVIGTLNVESPRVNGFGASDLQFTELFSKEIAVALHTLDLLSAQLVCTAAQSIEAVNKEIALPLDEVLAGASVLLEKWHRTDPEATARLRRILDAARLVKDCVSRVGRNLVETPTAPTGDLPLLGKRVLVIESDERLRRSAHLLLERLGATAESAATGEDAVAMAADADYDAVFQEVKPPDLGGYECYRRLSAVRPTALVSLTTGFGYDLAHSIVKARADGMKYVLFKPWRQEQVVRAVLDGPPPAHVPV